MNNIDWGYLFGMALQSVPEPRKVARDVFAFAAPRHALWLGFQHAQRRGRGGHGGGRKAHGIDEAGQSEPQPRDHVL